jgi:hypothetical protein
MSSSWVSAIRYLSAGGAIACGLLYAFPHLDARWVGLVFVVTGMFTMAGRGKR